MKVLLVLTLLAGCGAVMNDPSAGIDVTAPEGARVTVDGHPVRPGLITVSNHKTHVITATGKDGKPLGTCTFEPTVETKYAVLDVLAFSTIMPLVVDLITDDWASIPEGSRCDF